MRQILNHTPITNSQKAGGISAMEEHTGRTGISAEFFKDKPAFLEGGYAFVPKKQRNAKHGDRGIRAVFGSYDLERPSCVRVIPYEYVVEGETAEIHVFPTIVTDRWIRDRGHFPWTVNARTADLEDETRRFKQACGDADWSDAVLTSGIETESVFKADFLVENSV